MGFSNIEKKNFFYKALHTYAIFTHNKLFYRKVYVLNTENIPKDGHLIFSPNHQNALMDALAPLCNIDKQLVFLARSDIFKKKLVASILYFLKILPIFRKRDGYSAVKKNKSIFQKTIDVINAQNGLVVLPEGNHEGVHKLRQLKKGFARIAFQTEEASDFSLDIKIVPIGIHYSNYIKSRSDLYINYGKPLSVSEYYDLYRESAPKAVNKITADLAEKIKPLMVHIDSDEFYEFYDSIRSLYWQKMCPLATNDECHNSQRIKYEQRTISLLKRIENESPEKFSDLFELTKTYTRSLRNLGFSDKVFSKTVNLFSLITHALGFIAGLPLFFYGLFTNLIPIAIVKYAESKIKDPQFKSSFKYVVSIVVFPLFYIIPLVLLIIFCSYFLIGLMILISLPLSGLFSIIYAHAFNRFKMKWKLWFFKHKSPNKYKSTIATKTSMDQIINEAKTNFHTVG